MKPQPVDLSITQPIQLDNGTLLVAMTGWMDGGLVSTGTVQRIMADRDNVEVARIDAEPFYIYNFPGSMEIAALFRPEVKYDDGVIDGEMKLPSNIFHVDAKANLAFFLGREPNLRWQSFADCIFSACEQMNIKQIIFIGSFGGTTPHTREPRMFGTVSHPHLRKRLTEHGMRMSNYEGPSSFATLLLAQCPARDMEMLGIVAEIPGYLEGVNPRSIEAVARRLAGLLNQPVDLEELRKASNDWELRVSEAVEKDSELAETVRKLEDNYDNELIGRSEPST